MNMSYCMYENTSVDLNQVVADLEERAQSFSGLTEEVDEFNRNDDRLSNSERRAAQRLYDLCLRYVELMDEVEIENL